MKKNILDLIKEKRVYFDGGTGTVLQKRGLTKGKAPEMWNMEKPEEIISLHKSYLEAGADIIKTNTFGVNAIKYKNYEEYIEKALGCAKTAAENFPNAYIAFDMGPLGKLLKPWGDLDFLDAVETFKKNASLAKKYGADLILIETMNDAYETKAALLACKEASDLPVFVTNVYDEGKRLMTGATPLCMIAILESMGANAIGMNCSQGPDKMLPVVKDFGKYCSVPVIVNPNAGLPEMKNGETVYSFDAEVFSDHGIEIAKNGGFILGGCCGTSFEYISSLKEKTENIPLVPLTDKNISVAASYSKAVIIEDGVSVGNKLDIEKNESLKDALEESDIDYIVEAALDMGDEENDIITLNFKAFDDMLIEAVSEIQAVSNISMILKSENINALSSAMRIYNGKPLVYLYEAKADEILNLAKKYGALVIAKEELKEKAAAYGIKENDIVSESLFF